MLRGLTLPNLPPIRPLAQTTTSLTIAYHTPPSDSDVVVRLLLERGALRSTRNQYGHTAAALALFVGHHHCAATISNFVRTCDVASERCAWVLLGVNVDAVCVSCRST
jgi:ankyrin repeat protein